MKRLLIIALWGILGVTAWAQPQNYNALMNQAKSYFQQKEYKKSNECYEKVIAELEGTDYEHLVPTIRNSIAINNMYMGVAALKGKDFPAAKTYLEKAIKDAKPESKTYYMAHSWMGQWNSVQSLNIQVAHGDFQQALQFSLEAERYFDLAKASEKRLKEQLTRADILQGLSRNNDSEVLLKQIMAECEGVSDFSLIMGKAAYKLGKLEVQLERFQMAIQHLEQGYELCFAGSTIDAKSYAYLCANTLSQLFSKQIPDDEKAALWEQRANELESQTVK